MSDSEVAYPAADSTCSRKGCERPAWRSCPEGKCLYHSPSNGDSAEAARLVWNTARRMAADKDAEKYDFRGWYFPDDPDGRSELAGPIVGWFAGFRFEKPVVFFGATFSGVARFHGATFSGDAVFWGARFRGNAWFDRATFSAGTRFEGATFSGDAGFNNATFSGVARFDEATFSGEAWFEDATFSGRAGFEDAAFSGEAWFNRATFRKFVLFARATFSGRAWFEDAMFGGDARFNRATFSGEARFSGARFRPGVDIIFDKPHRGRPFRIRWAGETAYRLAKQAAQERGDYAEAGDYHYAEQCAIEDQWRSESEHKPWRKTFWLWWFRLLFGRLVYGYGERPMRPLFIALAVILLWAGFYCHWGAIVPSDPGLEPAARAAYEPGIGECLYCSIVTFTTLGYGDYQPKEPYRLLAASEALLGAALMAVFIVCLSKKYIR